MKLRAFVLVALPVLLAGACVGSGNGQTDRSELGVPACGDVDLTGLDVTVEESGSGELVVSSGGVPICAGSAIEVDAALGRDEDQGEAGTPLPSADPDGNKHPDELPGTPLPSATR